MREAGEREYVRELGSRGFSRAEIVQETGLPWSTVRNWLRDPDIGLRSRAAPYPAEIDLECDVYAYLLGLYLGDGSISRNRTSYSLTFVLDAKYPGIVARALWATAVLHPLDRVYLWRHPVHRAFKIRSTWKLWPVLFPQHGPGRKHTRRIELTDWQREITQEYPRELVRGLIDSDGCRYIARQRGAGGKTYEYARYAFANRSEDIKAIFCHHLDALGIGWTRPNAMSIAIDRRAEVAKLDEFIGPKY